MGSRTGRQTARGRKKLSLPGGVGVGTDDTNSVVSGGGWLPWGGGGRGAGGGSQMTDNEGCQ